MNFEIRQASRQGVKPLIGVYGESGCGKTYSALLLARGIVGPKGKIVMIDSESGRGSLYADVLPGGYRTLGLEAPFSPDRYIQAIRAVEKDGAEIGIIDSASHEWEGIGGVTDSAGEISRARAVKYNKEWDGVIQFGDWKDPKMAHQKFVMAMVGSSIPWIVCLRAKYKSRQIKGTKEMADAGIIQQNQIGRTVVVKDQFTSAIQAEDFIFEMTAHFEVLQDHTIHLTKNSHPSLKDCFPPDYKEPVTIQTGEAIGAWAAGGGGRSQPQKTAPAATRKAPKSSGDAKLDEARMRLRELRIKRNGDDFVSFEQWLIDEGHISDSEAIAEMGPDRITKLCAKIQPLIK